MAVNSHLMLAAMYGIWMLGAVEVAVNSALKGPLLKHVLDDSDPVMLIGDKELFATVHTERPELQCIDLKAMAQVTLESLGEPLEVPSATTLASLLYTSGTTGASKGVMIPHAYFSYFGATLGSVIELTERDTCYFTLPFFHVDAHIALPACLRWGSALAFAENFSVSGFWRDFMRFEATWFGAVGSMLSALITVGKPPQAALERLRLVLAAPVPQEAFECFEDAWGVPVLQMYGQTEANGPLYSTLEHRRRGAMGAPISGFAVRVVNESGDDVSPGKPGELLTLPAQPYARTLGYWRRSDANAQAFTDGWFHTGDLVRQDEDGFVWYLGRKSDSLRRRGENISAFELESVLAMAPGVCTVAAIGVHDALGGEDEVKAVLVVDESFDLKLFGEYCRASLPRYAVPRYAEIVEESQIVRGPGTGSIQKHLLPQGITQATVEVDNALYERTKKMKVVVTGGSGRVGARIVSELLAQNGMDVTVADRVRPRDETLNFVAIDLAEPASLHAAFAGADAVINAAGPFDRWGTTVLDAAIESGIDYIDVCDDPEPTLELLKRDAAARERGVRAVVGLGVSPGLTNFLAVIASQQLDTVDTLATFWGNSAEGMSIEQARAQSEAVAASFDAGRAAYTHLIVQTSSEVPVWRNHETVAERAWVRAYRVTTSQKATGLYRVIGHPEPVTLPRTIAMSDCLNIGTVSAGVDRIMLPVLDRVAAGEIDADAALSQIASDIRKEPERLATARIGDVLPRNIGAAAVGTRDGEADGVVVFPAGRLDGSMSLETARPAVVGAVNLRQAQAGVHAPETAFDAENFLASYAEIYWQGGKAYLVDEAGPNAVQEVSK